MPAPDVTKAASLPTAKRACQRFSTGHGLMHSAHSDSSCLHPSMSSYSICIAPTGHQPRGSSDCTHTPLATPFM